MLASLKHLNLEWTGLTGPIPPEFGNLASLEWLLLGTNPGLSGPLPASLTGLRSLQRLTAEGSGLCTPQDPGFQAWLAAIPEVNIALASRDNGREGEDGQRS